MPRTTLELEFLADHRKLTRGFRRLIDAVERGDQSELRRLAEDLDRAAGPHIGFEENVLYPIVEQATGAELGRNLRSEHQVACQALRTLLGKHGGKFDGDERVHLLKQLKVGLAHAVACGQLLSHLTVLDSATQADLLEKLREARQKNVRWTEFTATARESGSVQ